MKRWILNTLLVIFIAVFLVSGYFLVDYFLESGRQQTTFDQLADMMHQATQPPTQPPTQAPDTPDRETVPTEPGPTEPPTTVVIDPETGEEVELLQEFAELYLLNNDIVGWISIPDTRIDYPVMQKRDKTDYYLYRNFDEEQSGHGCIYVQESCDVFAPSDNLTIYGHRMQDGSMFQALAKYQNKDFWEENPYIIFNTLREHHTYEIFCVFTISSSVGTPFPYHQFNWAEDEADFDEFIANCQKYSLYSTGIVPQYGEKLISLSTCEYTHENGRLVVVARRID